MGGVPELVVVGCPSLDTLEVGGGAVEAPGGAGFNTALAARIAGVRVGLVATIPTRLPRSIAAAFGPGGIDRGGLVVTDGVLPSFHIRYDAAGTAEYLGVENGVEVGLSPDDIPSAWLGTGLVYLGPLAASARNQLRFARRVRERGFEGRLAAGCFIDNVVEDREAVLELASLCAVFFMNRSEADVLYPGGPPLDDGVRRCVTEGPRGVTIYDGATVHHPAVEVDVVDTTGAGDAFAGGYLAGLIRGGDAGGRGVVMAAVAIGGYGSTPLVEAVAAGVAPRVRLDSARIGRVAGVLTDEASGASLDFCGFPFPERDQPWALDCLALATLHQYGFWISDTTGWVEPMYAVAAGRRFKGSDYIWQAFTREVGDDPTIVSPARLAGEPDLFDRVCLDDDGVCPIPDVESHRRLQQAYGAALLEAGFGGFGDLLASVAGTDRPGRALLDRLSRLPGYAEDPLAKKANLLVIILANRPERFLDLRDPESVTPIVDYHLMRSCLRTGCVEIVDADLRRRIEARAWVDEVEEDEIRRAAFDAINRLVERSGLDQASVDGFFFTNARRLCVETSEPDCPSCPVAGACAQQRSLFQPVFRTTAY